MLEVNIMIYAQKVIFYLSEDSSVCLDRLDLATQSLSCGLIHSADFLFFVRNSSIDAQYVRKDPTP